MESLFKPFTISLPPRLQTCRIGWWPTRRPMERPITPSTTVQLAIRHRLLIFLQYAALSKTLSPYLKPCHRNQSKPGWWRSTSGDISLTGSDQTAKQGQTQIWKFDKNTTTFNFGNFETWEGHLCWGTLRTNFPWDEIDMWYKFGSLNRISLDNKY